MWSWAVAKYLKYQPRLIGSVAI